MKPGYIVFMVLLTLLTVLSLTVNAALLFTLYQYQQITVGLLEGVRTGVIDAVVTDHAPHEEARKQDLETAALSGLCGQGQLVLATGGGVVLREENRAMLHAIGLVVNLQASTEELARRLVQADDRPLLQGQEPLESRLARIATERAPFYADADLRIDTTGKTLEDVTAEILACVAARRKEAL